MTLQLFFVIMVWIDQKAGKGKMERISESGLGRLLHYNMTCIGGFMGTLQSAGLEGILPRPIRETS